jgi:hypothetical protein
MLLHEDKIVHKSYDDINHDISIIRSNDCVEGIAFKVKGKADPAPVTLLMWFDHDFPEIYPVHHLLAWLYLSGIAFFPDCNFLCCTVLKDSSWDGVCFEHIAYNDVLAAWKNICSSLWDRERKFGAHSGRKKGYLFGIWGGGQDSDQTQNNYLCMTWL